MIGQKEQRMRSSNNFSTVEVGAIQIGPSPWKPAINKVALDKVKSLRTKVNGLLVHSAWGSERDGNGRFPRWAMAAFEGVDRLKQYVCFTLKKWDSINPLGFAKTNKSVLKSPFGLIETFPTNFD